MPKEYMLLLLPLVYQITRQAILLQTNPSILFGGKEGIQKVFF